MVAAGRVVVAADVATGGREPATFLEPAFGTRTAGKPIKDRERAGLAGPFSFALSAFGSASALPDDETAVIRRCAHASLRAPVNPLELAKFEIRRIRFDRIAE